MFLQMWEIYQIICKCLKNIEDYNPSTKRNVLMVFGDMIAVMLTELIISNRNLNIYLFLLDNFIFLYLKVLG